MPEYKRGDIVRVRPFHHMEPVIAEIVSTDTNCGRYQFDWCDQDVMDDYPGDTAVRFTCTAGAIEAKLERRWVEVTTTQGDTFSPFISGCPHGLAQWWCADCGRGICPQCGLWIEEGKYYCQAHGYMHSAHKVESETTS